MSVAAVLRGVSVRLGTVQALDGVALDIEPGRFLALLGPSGSGKTTTLNVLAGFVQPDRGVVMFDGHDMTEVAPQRRDIGIVFQGYALFPHMSVAENVAFPLRMRRVRSAERARLVDGALAMVELRDHAARRVHTLSGGQQQRVALARAVVFEPRLLLLDEPLAALDKQLRDSMQLQLKRFQRELGITTVAVTHDQVEALTMADTVAVMRDGRVEQVGAPEEVYRRPATRFVATFLGEANLLPVRGGELSGFGRVPGMACGQAVLRPEHIGIGSAGALTAQADVEDVAFQGARLRARIRLCSAPDLVLTVTQIVEPTACALAVGDRVSVAVMPEAVHVIPDRTPVDVHDRGDTEQGEEK